MTAVRESAAERMRRHREEFELAVANDLTMHEAHKRIVQARWAAADARLRERLCGRRAPEPERGEDGGIKLQWWQR